MADTEGNKKLLDGTAESKHDVHERLDDTTSSSRDQEHPTFKDMLLRIDLIREKVEQDDCDDSNLLQHIEVLQKNVKEMLDFKPSNKASDGVKEQLIETLASKTTNEEKLNVVIAEYEKTIAKLVRDNACIVKERDTFQVHLANVEAAFTDVHQKYERCKGVIEGFKTNEQILKETIKANDDSILKLNNKYEALKTHAMGQLEKANNELIELKKNYEDEILRLKTIVKKLELKNSTLQQAVEQQGKENEELTRICDDLIAKVGR